MRTRASINQNVWKMLQRDLSIQKDLSRRIINMRALAKYLIKKYSLGVSIDSVISAIRRFQSSEVFEEEEKILKPIFSEAIVATRDNVACMTIEADSLKLLNKLCTSGEVPPLKMITGTKAIKLVIDQTNIETMKKILPKEMIVKIENDLSEISVRVPEKAIQTKGVLARIAGELALSNININEIIVCPPEFLVYVKQRDIVKAHESVLKLCRESLL